MKNINPWIAAALLIMAAVGEVASTGYLVDLLGIAKLVGLYVITTSFGLCIVWLGRNKQRLIALRLKQLHAEMGEDGLSSFSEDHPLVLYFAQIGMALGFFWIAAFLILIPGVVTDFIGLILLIIVYGSSPHRNFDPNYEPKL
ncbi:hypothetical protein LCGC14_1810060 [marine sediment metagenome]|uniref:Uncharacterized protein n=1 Tax=marine sediment metagenome TaxID=412755 RepID=A0A0F9GM77_9ZZZZ|nr:hypothetical protein [Porticoccus sp.]